MADTGADDPAIAALFGRLGLDPARVEHPPVHTVEEALPHWAGLPGEHTKNLFLKDGPRLYLVTLRTGTRADMKALAPLLGAKRLSFASPERLMEHLGTEPGSVGFLSLVKDDAKAVRFAVERALWDAERVTAHPLRNTATVSLTRAEFRAVLADLGVEPIVLDL
ncbi:prolyl-tRNA synthetase associated domain-containing protein [Lichenibacterium dinghuense]|uniref:prolyl-tRNA synthetase associated domain-containing protein n=1 Tax=Lichenibacterium dinghuense TaxID=2895977 RepID=UPI001F1822BF|nr:prolyl-tRNA synthetase associated domain-containing protein [Lichenibacterium sp. 6Y81]